MFTAAASAFVANAERGFDPGDGTLTRAISGSDVVWRLRSPGFLVVPVAVSIPSRKEDPEACPGAQSRRQDP